MNKKYINFLSDNITDKNIEPNTVKSIQFKENKFKTCGVCCRCGENCYIKLLIQLFGDNLMIDNAKGC